MKNRRQVQYRNVGQRGVTDPVASDASASSAATILSTDSSGNGTIGFVLAPKGVVGVNAAGTASATIAAPHMPWLYNTSKNFLEYRVTRATLVVVGNVGSTVSGTVAVMSTTDMIDIISTPVPGMGDLIVGGTSFALADLAMNNKRIPLRVDAMWKKVTSVTSQIIASNIITNASIDDICFSGYIVRVAGGPVSSGGVLTTYVEYDVEFRGVASTTFNV